MKYAMPLFALVLCCALPATPLDELFEERVRTMAAVEFYIQQEEDRRPISAFGLFLDGGATVVLQEDAVPNWVPPERLRDFRIYPLGQDSDGLEARYAGHEDGSGFHYLSLDEPADWAVSVQQFDSRRPRPGERIWSIGCNDREWRFLPYLLSGYLSAMVPLPEDTGFTSTSLGVPGAPVFDMDGNFVGWTQTSIEEPRLLTTQNRTLQVALRNPRESTTFMAAEVVLRDIQRRPQSPAGDPRPWLGIAGMQHLDREAADFLDLRAQGAVIVSDIISGSAAEAAGLQARDIIVAFNGQPLPSLAPRNLDPVWLGRQIGFREVGETITLTVQRDDEQLELTATLQAAPMDLSEAPRTYLKTLGLAVRPFIMQDALPRRILESAHEGAVASFVTENRPAYSAGLRQGDWLKEIDGQTVATYTEALELLTAIEEDDAREEAVLLIDRNNETQLIRMKLN